MLMYIRIYVSLYLCYARILNTQLYLVSCVPQQLTVICEHCERECNQNTKTLSKERGLFACF